MQPVHTKAQPASIEQVKILLVDDRPENLISLESLLRQEGEGITYLFAHSGTEALKIALKEELALILLDVQMPVMNGYEVAQYLRSNFMTRDIPIIFVTAIDEKTSHIVEGFEAGGVDFLFKPLHSFITRAKVSAFVSFYRQKKALEKAHRDMISLNRQLEERVSQRTEELLRINNDLDNFIYTASHDLKAPISNIEGLMNLFYKQLSKESRSSQEFANLQGMINESIERFKNTLQDLTEVAKVQQEAGTKDTVYFAELVEEVKHNIQEAISSSGAEISEDFSKAPRIDFSRKNLRSILYNLLSNAIKYSSPERTPQVSVSTSLSGPYVLLQVKDNGLGIAEKDQAKVFAMFKRLHTHVEGTGVGMAIVKRIVENSGGRIEIESKPGEGSCFKVYLK
ncbi:sensor histidine kinase [Cesiribacter andamanensis]|uniref:histidine kinase n=1 Tax=Cesiribacter andamanensis AMV16 TaxID=1279009 RepID=M7NJ68_9BACT|nr:hybrid sensor histidine kinase/response regulator [Cesiribacter andamanensis]EMR01805.1 Phytochrome-like protein cph1 [Cesiribacter andamanensis AMV16]